MVRYEIGPWEGGQKNEQTHTQTNRQRLANYNIDYFESTASATPILEKKFVDRLFIKKNYCPIFIKYFIMDNSYLKR